MTLPKTHTILPLQFRHTTIPPSHHRKPETTALVEKNTKEKTTSEKLKN
jgi:hypothetical protein